ncbi:unnamed protein product [Clonostachys solani]|uniref:DUF7703 domain-containing protein n=1 Tax=Clonostachys solani TaxID=160281 RepID=A0A9N9W3S8_9HYPO|nr:unnamed protein product [Clonostachys solani]
MSLVGCVHCIFPPGILTPNVVVNMAAFMDAVPGGRLLRRMTENIYSSEDVLVLIATVLSLYNAVELLVLIFLKFKRRRGLYFWSISLASFGIIPYCIGWMLVQFGFSHAWVGMTIDSIGWILLVSGHSMVLYSRLHLVLQNRTILRGVLGMIIVNGVVWHTTITVLLFGSAYTTGDTKVVFNHVFFGVLEKVQMTVFCVQEFIISGLYIWKTIEILKTAFGSKRVFLLKLYSINVFIIIMNIALLAIEYKSLFLWEQGVKVITYSIKLKLEFAVFGQLVEFVQHRTGNTLNGLTSVNTGAFVELSGSRTKKDTKGRPMTGRGEAIHMENIKTNVKSTTAIGKNSSVPGTLHHDRSQIKVTTRIDVDSNGGSRESGDSDSTRHLYEGAIQEIARS